MYFEIHQVKYHSEGCFIILLEKDILNTLIIKIKGQYRTEKTEDSMCVCVCVCLYVHIQTNRCILPVRIKEHKMHRIFQYQTIQMSKQGKIISWASRKFYMFYKRMTILQGLHEQKEIKIRKSCSSFFFWALYWKFQKIFNETFSTFNLEEIYFIRTHRGTNREKRISIEQGIGNSFVTQRPLLGLVRQEGKSTQILYPVLTRDSSSYRRVNGTLDGVTPKIPYGLLPFF